MHLASACITITVASCSLWATTSILAQCVEPSCTILQQYQGVAGTGFGWAVSEVGDVDGDGAMDVLTGTPFEITDGPNGGMAVVYSSQGGAPLWQVFGETDDSMGFAIADAGVIGQDKIHGVIVGAQSSTAVKPGKVLVLCAATGCEIFEVEGEAVGDRFGHAVASAGDVNGDGRRDILVGAITNDHRGLNSGRAYIFSGLDGALIRELNAEAAGDQFGSGVGGLGDVNSDGVPDQIVAARAAPHADGLGKAYVFSGSNGEPLWERNSRPGASQYGQFFVAGVGDVNLDGIPDAYVADVGHNVSQGWVYVYSGDNGDIIHEFPGMPGEGLGCGRGAGDVNGDGYADLVIGAWTNSEGAPNGGKVYVRSGRDGSVLRTITSTVAGEQRGYDAVGLGDINADHRIDFLVSAATGSRVYIFAGDIALPVPGDANGDATVNVDDLVSVILAWGPCDPKGMCPADVAPPGPPAGDGQVDVDDLILVILNWS
jgi:hypothetical protein